MLHSIPSLEYGAVPVDQHVFAVRVAGSESNLVAVVSALPHLTLLHFRRL